VTVTKKANTNIALILVTVLLIVAVLVLVAVLPLVTVLLAQVWDNNTLLYNVRARYEQQEEEGATADSQ
jgi:hypothetical protein